MFDMSYTVHYNTERYKFLSCVNCFVVHAGNSLYSLQIMVKSTSLSVSKMTLTVEIFVGNYWG